MDKNYGIGQVGGYSPVSSSLANTSEVKRETHTERTLGRLKSIVEENEGLVRSLHQRLNAVLRPESDVPSASDPKEISPLPALPQALQDIGTRIANTNQFISDMMARLEV